MPCHKPGKTQGDYEMAQTQYEEIQPGAHSYCSG